MKILQIAHLYYPTLGGVERHVQGISEHLAAMGHEVMVATLDHSGKLPRREALNGVQILRFRAFGSGPYLISPGLVRFLLRYRHHFDAVHAHNYHALPLLFAALICQQRCVTTPCYHRHAHSRVADLMHKVYDPIGKAALRRAGAIVCLSRGEVDEITDCLGVARDRIDIVPSGIDLEGTRPSDGGRTGRKKMVLSVGRLDRYKRVDRLIEAVASMPAEYFLVMAGAGPEKEPLAQLAGALGVSDKVLLLGRVTDDELSTLYDSASVVASLSEAESFGIVVLEALAHGIPVVCSDIPAFADFNRDFPGAVTLVGLDRDPSQVADLVRRAAEAPRQAVDLRKYGWDEVVESLLKVYRGVADKAVAARTVGVSRGEVVG